MAENRQESASRVAPSPDLAIQAEQAEQLHETKISSFGSLFIGH